MSHSAEIRRLSGLKDIAKKAVATTTTIGRTAQGYLRQLDPRPVRFSGAYDTYDQAYSAAQTKALAGYDHDEVATVSYTAMCKLMPWDYPVLFWLQRLLDDCDSLLDAGGHMGTKYRAFRPVLGFDDSFEWTVYDVPAIVKRGRQQAAADNLSTLHFVDTLTPAHETDIFLASGLLQYLDVPLPALLRSMKTLPQHLILNKVAFHTAGSVVTLEKIGKALVPYQMRDEAEFCLSIEELGYVQIDRWDIPSLGRAIDTHPQLGPSNSAGFYYRLSDGTN